MKTFLNTLQEATNLKQVNSENGRTYVGDGFRYPSVTTVTGLHTADGIKAWRQKVGAEEANRITKKASNRGTKIHTICESYLRHGMGAETTNLLSESNLAMFESIRPHLDKIDNIHCLETKMVSHSLCVAGTVDCIGHYGNGPVEVMDFKTSGKPKQKQWLDHYFMQAAAYSCMFFEATDITVNKLRLIIGVDGHDCQIFEEPMLPWIKQFKTLRERFRREKGY